MDIVTGIVKRAIKDKASLALEYQGKERLISPHLLGVTKDNRMVVHAFQFGGESSKGAVTPETGGWRFFYLDEATAIDINPALPWYPEQLAKSELEAYKPPKFIEEVLALVGA